MSLLRLTTVDIFRFGSRGTPCTEMTMILNGKNVFDIFILIFKSWFYYISFSALDGREGFFGMIKVKIKAII